MSSSTKSRKNTAGGVSVEILDYFVMVVLSPILVPVMWFARWTARASFVPPAKAALTILAVPGTMGTAFFWIRLFS